ncbi:MAG: hypothetical protein ACI8W8_000837 [Rhodothermales bacterium]|jgi:hypothetical protein
MIDAETIVRAATELFKQKLSENLQKLDPATSLTAAVADDFGKDIKTIACQAAAEGIRQFLSSFDERHDTLIVDGHTYYPREEQEPKILMTIAGKIRLPRWAYQSNTCNRVHIPLDLKCGIDREFAMPAVREALLYINSELSPRSVETFLKKVGTFQISHTANENIIK